MRTYYVVTLIKDGRVIDATTKMTTEAVNTWLETAPLGSNYTVIEETI